MGTRNMVGVILNGEWKVAQYGQWDGYVDSSGVAVLNVLRDGGAERLREKLHLCRFVDAEELKRCCDCLGEGDIKQFYPGFSRDTGWLILSIIENSDKEVVLFDNHRFMEDVTFCEYAYVVDYDVNALICYVDGNTEWKRYPLNALPTGDEMIEDYQLYVKKNNR